MAIFTREGYSLWHAVCVQYLEAREIVICGSTHVAVEGTLGVELGGDRVEIPVHALSRGSRCQ